MKLIFEDIKRRKIGKSEDIIFTLETSGFYLIQVSARTKGEKELGGTDDEDLKIEIDKRKFPKLDNPERYFDSPASFSGGQLKNLKKSVFFILRLNSGRHIISLIPDISAMIEEIKVWQISVGLPTDIVEVSLEERAEDGDRRPWMTFVLIDLGLKEFSVTLNLKRRFIDSDDVEESIFWGVRWLYHKAQRYSGQAGRELDPPYKRWWINWEEAIRDYNGNPSTVDEYIREVFSVYENGRDLEGNQLW